MELRADGTKLPRGQNNAPYLAARLKRDAPAIAARVERGEFRSIRAAAIEAGIVKVPTIMSQMQKLWLKATDPERLQFCRKTQDKPAVETRTEHTIPNVENRANVRNGLHPFCLISRDHYPLRPKTEKTGKLAKEDSGTVRTTPIPRRRTRYPSGI